MVPFSHPSIYSAPHSQQSSNHYKSVTSLPSIASNIHLSIYLSANQLSHNNKLTNPTKLLLQLSQVSHIKAIMPRILSRNSLPSSHRRRSASSMTSNNSAKQHQQQNSYYSSANSHNAISSKRTSASSKFNLLDALRYDSARVSLSSSSSSSSTAGRRQPLPKVPSMDDWGQYVDVTAGSAAPQQSHQRQRQQQGYAYGGGGNERRGSWTDFFA